VPSVTWYDPDQTVGFWIRRMAQETVIHRVDAELTAAAPLAAIPADVAVDGVDKVLVRFLDYGSRRWRDEFTGSLPGTRLQPVLVTTGDQDWLVHAATEGVRVEPAAPDAPAAASVSGPPAPLLLWLWNRGGTGEVVFSGEPGLVDALHALLVDATG
jgi:hypothetical protein